MTDESSLMYAIPPYLLNTCQGAALQKDLAKIDQNLANFNVLTPNSNYFVNEDSNLKTEGNFSNDPCLNDIIKAKVHYKLSLIGVLGDNPLSSDKTDTGFLVNLAEQYIDQLLYEDNLAGEVFLESSFFESVPKSHTKYLSYPLADLLKINRTLDQKYNYPRSFIRDSTHANKIFDYPLPISWSPFLPFRYLQYLNKNLTLNVKNSGFSTIHLQSNQNIVKLDENISKKYFNFITDKPISPSAGVFYYEIELTQETTPATNFEPLIIIDKYSVSSGFTSHISTGFIEKDIHFDANLDKLDIHQYQRKMFESAIDDSDIENLITSKPGEFKGSYAVNFSDLLFHNASKVSKWIQRSNPNVNLHSEGGKIDLGIPFKTRVERDDKIKKIYVTDVVGCGINFIEQSIFITLNGVLAKTISKVELDASTFNGKNLFSGLLKNNNNTVCPIIGFEVNDIKEIHPGDPTTCKIVTNLGFKEFKFNISNYTKQLKSLNPNHTGQNVISNTDQEEKIPVHDLVKGYLNHEGYVETFRAFSQDLKDLAEGTNFEVDSSDYLEIQNTQSTNRAVIKNYIMTCQFDSVLKFISLNYPTILSSAKGKEVHYKIKFLDVIHKIKTYVNSVINSEDSFEFETEVEESSNGLYAKAFERCKLVRSEFKAMEKTNEIDELTSILLISDINKLKSLSKTNNYFQNFDRELKLQSSELKTLMMQSLGYTGESNLETIINIADKNIRELTLEHHDDRFMLVNFEKDHIDF